MRNAGNPLFSCRWYTMLIHGYIQIKDTSVLTHRGRKWCKHKVIFINYYPGDTFSNFLIVAFFDNFLLRFWFTVILQVASFQFLVLYVGTRSFGASTNLLPILTVSKLRHKVGFFLHMLYKEPKKNFEITYIYANM